VKPDNFFAELKRRNVYKVAVAYAVVGWLLVQVATQVFPFFEIPAWVVRLVVLLLIVGFPIALVLSWAFELTPEGIRREGEVDRSQSITRRTGRKLTALIVIVAALAAGLMIFRLLHSQQASEQLKQTPLMAAIDPKSIAVLPFENLSAEKENAFFTDGVQDQILSDLAKVADLKVISHASVEQYKSESARNLRQIGQQLGVAYILQGSVQRAGSRLRVSAQLNNARTDEQLWAETYDRDLSDVFAIQSEIAQTIVSRLQATLSPQEKARIEEQPTRDMVAFDLYLQAKELIDGYLNAPDPRSSFLQALRLLDEATARDPAFVLAYAYAARAHDLLYFFDLDPTPARAVRGQVAAEKALSLQPDSAEAHLSMADFYFRCQRDYAQADKELALARPGLPNSTAFFVLAGYIHRRQGRWEEAEQDFKRAVELDPRSPSAVNLLADTYVLLRRFSEGARYYDRALAAGLDLPIIHLRRDLLLFSASGDVKILRAALAQAPAEMDVGGGETPLRILLALLDHDYERASRLLAASPRENFQEVDFSFYYPRAWYQARIAQAKGDEAAARDAFARAREILATRLTSKPNDARTLAVLAEVDAGLGASELAIKEAKHAVELMPISRDAYDGVLVLQGLAQVYTWTGQNDRALEILHTLMHLPGYLSYGYLRVDPSWAPLRSDPRFEQFVASFAPR
jgi:TolB-like protein/Tfp pilus assembly protein PilF